MATSPAHKFGQLIGDVLELTIEPLLADFAKQHGLYLDKKGPRPAREGNKLTWTDLNGNKHDLDFVLERGGAPDRRGVPVAFIETAWRRYTKHSRNKAQEIQGAILPLCETHSRHCPFKGAVLAGAFTDGALAQLKSLGFSVAYFPYESIVRAFGFVGIDADFDEHTPDADFAKRVRKWKALKPAQKERVSRELVSINRGEIDAFTDALTKVTMRTIKAVRILPLHGREFVWANVEEAITFIRNYQDDGPAEPIVRYEVQVLYVNADEISGNFGTKDAAIDFLQSYGTLLPDVSR